MSPLGPNDSSLFDGALRIVRILREAGHEAYYAGGAVRDLLLDRPVSDIDIATSAEPSQIESLFPATVPVGRQFGVLIVREGDQQYEVATFRRDLGYADGRHPTGVDFSNAREDALRRDFTINALFYDPEAERVLDFVAGRADLKSGIVRTVGDPAQRFAEDKLRLIRAVRFSCELGFSIESSTLRELKARAGQIVQVSSERIRDELLKILTGRGPAEGLELLHETGLLASFLPEVAAMAGVPQPPEFHPEGDVFVHTCLMFRLAGPLHEALALGILLHDVGKPGTFRVAERIRFDGHAELGATLTDSIGRRLRLPNETIHRVVELVRGHLRFMHVRDMRESTLKRFLRQEHFADHLELHRLDCLASHGDLSNYEFCT
ncbi:MAG: CCA tRNA nucleotidyltransferase, partial [Acidobacteriota bacterium]